jgi:hypothetical protein
MISTKKKPYFSATKLKKKIQEARNFCDNSFFPSLLLKVCSDKAGDIEPMISTKKYISKKFFI